MSDTASTQPPTGTAAVPAQLRALWAKLPARARTAALASTVAIVGLVAYLMLQGGGAAWEKVTPGLTPTDATELIGVLNDRGIPNRLRPGSVVEVPAGRVAEARAAAVVARVPRSQVGLEILDKTIFGSSSEQDRIRYQRALQGQLGQQIEQLAPIARARVNLAFGARSVFKDGAQPATASVQVSIRPGMTLSPQQVLGIKQSIANAVTGLDVEKVAVIDQNATPLSSNDERAGDEQVELESRLAANVRKMLETVTGAGKVKVVAQVELDRRTVSKTEETLGEAVVLSKQETVTGGASAPTTGGITGVQGNLPGSQAPTTGAVGTAGAVTSSIINHQIPRTITQIAEPTMKVARIHLAVLVDQTIDEDGEPVARPAAEMKQLEELARTAAGLNKERGDELSLQSMPFAPIEAPVVAPPPAKPLLPVPVPYAVGAGAAVVLLALVLLFRRRKAPATELTSTRIALPAPVAELERALDSTGGDVASLGEAAGSPQLPSGRSLEERVLGAVRGDVARATRVLAGWLNEPDPVATASHAAHAAHAAPASTRSVRPS